MRVPPFQETAMEPLNLGTAEMRLRLPEFHGLPAKMGERPNEHLDLDIGIEEYTNIIFQMKL